MPTVQERGNIKSWNLSDSKEPLLTSIPISVTAFMELMLT